jgi:ABC-type uncharacterized transport system substrate-binding protein
MTVVRVPISKAVLILVSAHAVLTAPLVGQAQTAAKVARIGVIGESSPPDPLVAAFWQGLRELGHAERESIFIEERYLEGVLDRAPKLAAELIQLRVDVLVVGETVVARAVRAQTSTVPIVFTLVSDPVASGLVTSLSRPGGNATGLSTVVADLSGKQLEFLQAAVPSAISVAVVFNPGNPTARSAASGVQEAARSRAMRVHLIEVRNRHELPTALSASAAKRVDALLAISDPAVTGIELAKLAAAHRLPAITAPSSFVKRGGLLAYGPSYSHNWFRAATYVDKILKGARPADIPVERPMKFELAINLKIARTLGLTIPQSLLLLADEVIQ